jgi:hypothetical protein
MNEAEEKIITDAINSVKVSIRARTEEGSEERVDAMYHLQDVCDTLGMVDITKGR